MYSWNQYSVCDENTGQLEQCYSSTLFDIQSVGTLYKGESDQGINFSDGSEPLILSALSDGKDLVIAAKSAITLYDNSGSLQKSVVNLSCTVDALCFRPDGKQVIVADNGGNVHILDCVDGSIIFTHNLLAKSSSSKESVFSSVFCINETNSGFYTFGVSMHNGKVCIFRNIQLDMLSLGCKEKDIDVINEVKSSMSMQQFDASCVHTGGIVQIIGFNNGMDVSYVTAGKGCAALALWEKEDYFDINENDECNMVAVDQVYFEQLFEKAQDGFVKCVQCNNEDSWDFYTLDNHGSLYQWSICDSIVLSRAFSGNGIKDFVISGSYSNKAPRELYTIQNGNGLSLGIYNLPSMEKIYSTNFESIPLALFSSCPSTIDELVLLTAEATSFSQEIDQLSVRLISKALPEDRLARLLHKNKFSKALEFAEQYNLDSQQIYEAKATFLMNLINAEQKNIQEKFQELVECLKLIVSEMLVAQICANAVIPDLRLAYNLLIMGRTRLECYRTKQLNLGQEDEDALFLFEKLGKYLSRLVTYQLIYGSKCFKENMSSLSEEDSWLNFRDACLPVHLFGLIATGNLNGAAQVLTRHKAELISFLCIKDSAEKQPETTSEIVPTNVDLDVHDVCNKLKLIFSRIPYHIEVVSLTTWLEDFLIPTLIVKIPFSETVIAKWLCEKTEKLEHDLTDWPLNALRLANTLFTVKNRLSGNGFMNGKFDFGNEEAAEHEVEGQEDSLQRLRMLVSRLEQLIRLQERYNCTVTLKDLAEESTMSLTYRMLDRVMVPELIAQTLDNNIRPYMKEQNLDENDVLLGYVKDILAKHQFYIEGIAERRVVEIIGALKDKTHVVKATAILVKKAVVPWSEHTSQLVKATIQWYDDNKLSLSRDPVLQDVKQELEECMHSIRHSQQLSRLPEIKAQYGCQCEINESSPMNSANCMEFVMFLVRHNDSSAFDQAVAFVRDFSNITILDVYKFKLVELIDLNQLDACVALLDKAFDEGSDFGLSLLRRAVGMCSTTLCITNEIWKEDRIKYCQALIQLICHCNYTKKYSEYISYEYMLELNDSLAMFKNILSLQEKYGKLVSVEEYISSDYRDSCMKQLIKDTQHTLPSTPLPNGGQGDAVICSFSTTMFSNTLSLPQEKDQPSEDLESINTQDLFNYASLLGIASNTIHSKMVESAVKSSGMSTGAKICSDILTYSPGPESAAVVYKFILSVLDQFESCDNPVKILGLLTELCAASLACCLPQSLMDFSNVYSLLSLCRKIFDSTNFNPKSFLMGPASGSSDKLDTIDWLHQFYTEKAGIQLNPADTNKLLRSLIPQIVNNKTFLQSRSETDYLTLQKLQVIVGDAITMFRGAGRYLLAYNWITYCGFVTLLHMSNGVGLSSNAFKKMKKAEVECSQSLCKVAEELVIKVLNSKEADIDLAVGLLTSIPLEKATNLIKNNIDNTSRNYKRMMSYTTAGLNFLKLHEMETEILKFQSYFLNVYWGFTLGNIDIDVKSILFSSASSKVNVVPIIMRHKNITGKIIKDFCTDYNLDINTAMLDYAGVLLADTNFTVMESKSPMLTGNENKQIALNSPNAQSLFLKSFCGKDGLQEKDVMEEDEEHGHRGRPWATIKTQLKFIMENVHDIYELCDGLYNIAVRKIHPYAYKRLEYILDCILQHNIQHLQEDIKKILKIIDLLKHYQRGKGVGESELQWFREQYGMGALPGLSKTRLPIHPMIQGDYTAWKIFELELSEDSIQYLLPVARLLDFSIDKVYTAAATSIITAYLETENIKVPKGKILSIKHLVGNIAEKNLATAVAKSFTEMLPTSQEKVDAFNWCIELATKWLSASGKEPAHFKAAQKTLDYFQKSLKNTSTELILKKYSLDSPSFVHLINIPQKLVVSLYKHDSIVERYHHPNKVYPDIHEAANQIADVHRDSVDIAKIRNLMMIEWLLTENRSSQEEDEDSTINLANQKVSLLHDGRDKVTNMMDSENIIRLLYILSYERDDATAKTLISVIQRDDNRITNSVKANGFYCLLKVFPDYIQKISGKQFKELKLRLQIMTFVSELESVGCSLTPDQFSSCVKAELAQSIVSSASHQRNGKAVRTAAEICRVFSSWCPKTWYIILQNLVATEQVVYLHQLLREISWNPVICSLPCLPTVWQSCVTQPLVKMTSPLNKDETKTCLACYNFLLECPVLLQIDLKTIAQHFCNIELPILAMGCLLCNPAEYMFAMQVAQTRLTDLDGQMEQLDMKNHAIAGQTLIMDCIKSITV